MNYSSTALPSPRVCAAHINEAEPEPPEIWAEVRTPCFALWCHGIDGEPGGVTLIQRGKSCLGSSSPGMKLSLKVFVCCASSFLMI